MTKEVDMREGTTRTIQVGLPDHLQTEEGAARLDQAIEVREQADFQCFMVLQDLAEAQVLDENSLLAALQEDIYHQDRPQEALETAQHLAGQVADALKKRRDADQEFGDALRNIPKREE